MSQGFDFQSAFDKVHDRIGDVHIRITDVDKKLVETKTKLDKLVGNGQPGEIQTMQTRIGALEKWKERSAGYIAGAVGVITGLGVLGHFLIDVLRKR